MTTIADLAIVCRSKNAGPFELTLDVAFADRATYERVERTGALTPASIARAYGVAVAQVLFTAYPAAHAFKATIPRRVAAGAVNDTDVYGSQQHAPLLALVIKS